MNGSLTDACGVLAAAALGVPVVLLPGYALGRASGVLGFRGLDARARFAAAALLGIALLPLLDSLIARVAGLPAALALTLALACAGLPVARSGWRGARAGWACALAALWLGAVLYALIDVDTGAALYQPLTVIDLVKHAALTRAIGETGVPPLDPFFGRPEPVSYYYYFYTLCALVDRLGGSLVDGRAAFSGLVFWTGVALYGLLGRLLAASGLVRGVAGPATAAAGTAGAGLAALLIVLPAGGLDIAMVLKARFVAGTWPPIPEWLTGQVTWWPASLIWVPHHVAALLAGWLGLLALAEVPDRDADARIAVAVAGPAFAACAGLSLWVCLGVAATAAAWLAWFAAERRWRDAGRLAGAGLLGLALFSADLRDILANRDGAGSAVAFAVRAFGPVEGIAGEPVMSLVRLALLPLNYYLGFGVFAAGSLLFWRLVPAAEAHAREAGRLLTLAAGAGLLVGGFLRSAILNNDLGWRVVLLAQVAALVWTVAALVRTAAVGSARPRLPGFLTVLLCLGYATTLYGLAQMRAYPASGDPGLAFVNARTDIDRALRDAYAWAGARLPADRVLQANPAAPRVFAFGLYGRQRVAVADADAQLFGAPADAVDARLARLAPVFRAGLSATEARRRAREAGIDALVLSAADPVWADPESWVWRAPAVYAGPLVRIVRVEDLDG